MKLTKIFGLITGLIIIAGFISSCGGSGKEETSEKITSAELLQTEELNMLTKQEKAEGWRLLFDGETKNGWRAFKKESVGEGWIVKEGNFIALGKGGDIGGDIITEEQFENFELKLEWKISEGGNSGILYNVLEGEEYGAVYATGPEYQLIDDIGFPQELGDWQKSGANYAMHPPVNAELKEIGEWNSSRIVILDGFVEHWLNGKKVVEYQLWTDEWKELVQNCKWVDYPDYGLAKKGHIALQDHGSVIAFRNIKVRDL